MLNSTDVLRRVRPGRGMITRSEASDILGLIDEA